MFILTEHQTYGKSKVTTNGRKGQPVLRISDRNNSLRHRPRKSGSFGKWMNFAIRNAPSSNTLPACLLSSLPASSVLLRSDPIFGLKTVPYNLAIPVHPLAVVYANSSEDVAAAVKCASKFGKSVQAKSGGHGYANYAYGGGDNETVVVDLRNMKRFVWDATGNWIAHVGAGNLLQDLNKQMSTTNRAFAHGTCPQVGIGGHATMGGLGPASRMWGTALDHIQSATVVLANGTITQASATSNPDLLWAIKGSGASFGIVTQFDIITHAPPSQTVQYSYTFSGLPFSQHAEQFKDWQKLASNTALDRRFSSNAIFTPLGLVISGTFFGNTAEWDALNMTSIFSGASAAHTLVLNNWLGTVGFWAENMGLEVAGWFPNSFYAASLAFTPTTLLSDAAIDSFLAFLDTKSPLSLLWFAIFDVQGGATNDVPMDATAYAHRDTLFYFQPYVSNGLLPLPDSAVQFVTGLMETMTDRTPGLQANGAYPGYIDPRLQGAQQAYWKSNYAKLQQLKATYDPKDTFHNPQSVRLPK
ncbi:FAD-binding domain-containing protein [Microthyrium microscopicum]|uniref:FAD-binding domain-containing protein n=1 Tax=Microthyrium microscopicum TaxID=703497 RepID=A0A6A6UCQ8_9PEZI|nr:FAD-binding domain-containing protein [Microthyrium microscopicum]